MEVFAPFPCAEAGKAIQPAEQERALVLAQAVKAENARTGSARPLKELSDLKAQQTG